MAIQHLPDTGAPHADVEMVGQVQNPQNQAVPDHKMPHLPPAIAELPVPPPSAGPPTHCWQPVRGGIHPEHVLVHGTVSVPQEPCAGTEKPATSSALAAKKQTVAIERDIVSFIEELLCILLTTYSGLVPTICAILLLFNIL